MEIGIIRMSSKGQIVIPASMRRDLDEGEQLVIIRDGGRFILKPLDDLEPALEDDLRFAERTEKAYLEFEKGEFTREKDVDFLHKLKSW
ncbi:AbrB/MazE/SpoVT family DNA-binding domain-containing protein [Methanocalculus sp. MC3]|jgi:looped-hinge helix DNA binding domain, AbrB family